MRERSIYTCALGIALAATGCSAFDSLLPAGGSGGGDWTTATCEVRTCSADELDTGEDPWSWTAHDCVPEGETVFGPEEGGGELASLDPAAGCHDLVDHVKLVLAHTTKKALEANLHRALELHCQSCREPSYAQDAASSGPEPDPGDTASDFSETNLQVPGVDEADFVKNDGGYIYMVAGNQLTIIDAWPAEEAHILSQVAVEGTPKRLYVHADRAVVYSMVGPELYPAQECTYGYTCQFTGDGRAMKITVFDITDRANPVVTREISSNGSYLNSRRIGDIVHTVLVSPPLNLPERIYWPSELPQWAPICGESTPRYSAREIRDMFQALWLENKARIANLTVENIMPALRDVAWENGAPSAVETELSLCSEAYLSRTRDGVDLVTLASFDVTEQGPVGLTTVFGNPGAVYASADSLYIAQPHFYDESYGWYYGADTPHATTIHKFRLTDGNIATEYAASGVVKGRIINQFAMDEKDGYLRMATTTGYAWGADTHSTVMTLEEQEDELVVAGAVDNLAPTEDIRSVRFVGDAGYVVTFKKTDPLFVIDLADPTHPQLRGELHIPGFSTYMHPLDPDHLLSIGYDAEDMESFAWFQGVMLQVMDVADLDSPELLHREVIGTRGTTSDAATNHLAFNYFASRSLLGIPMVVCEGSEGGSDYGDHVSFDGLLVYRVDLEGGFSLLGGVPHADPYDLPGYQGCSHWWSDPSTSPVKRSVFMEDWVYSIAMNQIRIAHLDDLGNPVVDIDL